MKPYCISNTLKHEDMGAHKYYMRSHKDVYLMVCRDMHILIIYQSFTIWFVKYIPINFNFLCRLIDIAT